MFSLTVKTFIVIISLILKTIKMEKELLKEIILEQDRNLASKDTGVQREILSNLEKHFKLPHAIVVSGLRRVGKSTLLLQIIRQYYQNKGYYFNFEDERLLKFTVEDFNKLYELLIELFGEKKVFFFDEIQNIPGWENFVRRLQEEEKIKFFLTGSNASLLSRELGSKLTGRYLSTVLYPFSFREYLTYKNYYLKSNSLHQMKERAKIKRYFNHYLEEGGMPEYLKYHDQEILKRIYEDILYRDIAVRYNLKEVRALRELALYYFSNLASLVSFNRLKEFLRVGSVNTIKSYTEYLENSYLIFTINLYSFSVAQQFIAPKKVYCLDNGLAQNIAFKFSQNKGQFLENLVFIELKRQNKEIFYYKTKSNKEVNFVLKEGNEIKQIIQVALNLNSEETKKREIESLKQAMNELNLKEGLILTNDEKDEIKVDDKIIRVIPIYQWLLTP